MSNILTDIYAPKVAEGKEEIKEKYEYKYEVNDVITYIPSNANEQKIKEIIDFTAIFLSEPEDTLRPLYVSTMEDTELGETKVKFHEEKGIGEKIKSYLDEITSDYEFKTDIVRRVDRTFISGIFTAGIDYSTDLLLINIDQDNLQEDELPYFYSKTIDGLLRKTIFPVGVYNLMDPINLIESVKLILTNDSFQANKASKLLQLSEHISKSINANLEILDVSYLPQNNVRTVIEEALHKKQYKYYKFAGISAKSKKILSFTGFDDLVVLTLPPYHPVFSISGYDKPEYYQTIDSVFTNSSFLFIYYPNEECFEVEDEKRKEATNPTKNEKKNR